MQTFHTHFSRMFSQDVGLRAARLVFNRLDLSAPTSTPEVADKPLSAELLTLAKAAGVKPDELQVAAMALRNDIHKSPDAAFTAILLNSSLRGGNKKVEALASALLQEVSPQIAEKTKLETDMITQKNDLKQSLKNSPNFKLKASLKTSFICLNEKAPYLGRSKAGSPDVQEGTKNMKELYLCSGVYEEFAKAILDPNHEVWGSIQKTAKCKTEIRDMLPTLRDQLLQQVRAENSGFDALSVEQKQEILRIFLVKKSGFSGADMNPNTPPMNEEEAELRKNYDKLTAGATAVFQMTHGLIADGSFGEKSYEAILAADCKKPELGAVAIARLESTPVQPAPAAAPAKAAEICEAPTRHFRNEPNELSDINNPLDLAKVITELPVFAWNNVFDKDVMDGKRNPDGSEDMNFSEIGELKEYDSRNAVGGLDEALKAVPAANRTNIEALLNDPQKPLTKLRDWEGAATRLLLKSLIAKKDGNKELAKTLDTSYVEHNKIIQELKNKILASLKGDKSAFELAKLMESNNMMSVNQINEAVARQTGGRHLLNLLGKGDRAEFTGWDKAYLKMPYAVALAGAKNNLQHSSAAKAAESIVQQYLGKDFVPTKGETLEQVFMLAMASEKMNVTFMEEIKEDKQYGKDNLKAGMLLNRGGHGPGVLQLNQIELKDVMTGPKEIVKFALWAGGGMAAGISPVVDFTRQYDFTQEAEVQKAVTEIVSRFHLTEQDLPYIQKMLKEGTLPSKDCTTEVTYRPAYLTEYNTLLLNLAGYFIAGAMPGGGPEPCPTCEIGTAGGKNLSNVVAKPL